MDDHAVMKSAYRGIQIFEFFAEFRKPATVTQIYKSLGLPQSTVSKLLGSLARIGYLNFDPQTRTYNPTFRLAILSEWLHGQCPGNQNLLRTMEGIRLDLGTSVVLGVQRDKAVQLIMTLPSTSPQRSAPPIGALGSICRTGVGQALLMLKSDEEVALLARRINAEAAIKADLVDQRALLCELRECRRRGYALSEGTVVPGVRVAAMPLPAIPGQPRMALGVGASADWFTCENLSRALAALSARIGATDLRSESFEQIVPDGSDRPLAPDGALPWPAGTAVAPLLRRSA